MAYIFVVATHIMYKYIHSTLVSTYIRAETKRGDFASRSYFALRLGFLPHGHACGAKHSYPMSYPWCVQLSYSGVRDSTDPDRHRRQLPASPPRARLWPGTHCREPLPVPRSAGPGTGASTLRMHSCIPGRDIDPSQRARVVQIILSSTDLKKATACRDPDVLSKGRKVFLYHS